MEMMLALGMIEHYVLALKDGEEQSKKFENFTPRKPFTAAHTPHIVKPVLYDSAYNLQQYLYFINFRPVINRPQSGTSRANYITPPSLFPFGSLRVSSGDESRHTKLLVKSKWCDLRQVMTGIAYLCELIGTVAGCDLMHTVLRGPM